MSHDGVPSAVIVLICIGYMTFVAQLYLYTDWRKADPKSVRPIMLLMGVFIFCALSGYGATLIPDAWAAKSGIRIATHWVLALFTTGLVLSNQAKVISRLLEK